MDKLARAVADQVAPKWAEIQRNLNWWVAFCRKSLSYQKITCWGSRSWSSRWIKVGSSRLISILQNRKVINESLQSSEMPDLFPSLTSGPVWIRQRLFQVERDLWVHHIQNVFVVKKAVEVWMLFSPCQVPGNPENLFSSFFQQFPLDLALYSFKVLWLPIFWFASVCCSCCGICVLTSFTKFMSQLGRWPCCIYIFRLDYLFI